MEPPARRRSPDERAAERSPGTPARVVHGDARITQISGLLLGMLAPVGRSVRAETG